MIRTYAQDGLADLLNSKSLLPPTRDYNTYRIDYFKQWQIITYRTDLISNRHVGCSIYIKCNTIQHHQVLIEFFESELTLLQQKLRMLKSLFLVLVVATMGSIDCQLGSTPYYRRVVQFPLDPLCPKFTMLVGDTCKPNYMKINPNCGSVDLFLFI